MEHWVEHYSELYTRENIECLPILEELDEEPTVDELSKALDSLAPGKAPGRDSIPAEELKWCRETLITSVGKKERSPKT